MKLIRGFEEPSRYRGGFVSIGNFDGVHRGHQSMIATLVRNAHDHRVPSVVLTFDPHPIQLLRPGQAPPSLSTVERKAELLGKCGVDCVIAYPTDETLLHLSPEAFFEQIVRGELRASGLVEGPNFFFGHNRAGDISTLLSLCDSAGLLLEIVSPVKVGERFVSSSVVRSRIAEGAIVEAVELLGNPYRIHGTVTTGANRGRSIGFPTANLQDIANLLPPNGVYAGLGYTEGGSHPAAIHLGPNLTFGETTPKTEVHLVGFSGDLYNQALDVDLLKRLRDVQSFGSVDELREQLQRDIEAACVVAEAFRVRQGNSNEC